MSLGKRAVVAVAVAGLVVAAGCGGTKHLSKPDFISKANAICKEGNAKLDAGAKRVFGTTSSPSTAQIEKFNTEVVVPDVQEQLDRLRKLGAPKGEEAKVKAIFDAAQKGVDTQKANPKSLPNQDTFGQANKLAGAYGLTTCAS